MAVRKINPWLKLALELGPVLLFFVGYMRIKDQSFVIGGTSYDGFILMTAAFIPVMIACTVILWVLTGHLSRMQVLTLVLVTVFGGLSVWLNDERFFKMKLTIIYLLFAAVLGVGLLQGKSYLRFLMDEVVSKWGVGSGVGLFIVAGISQQLVTGLINPATGEAGLSVGIIPKWIDIIRLQLISFDTLFTSEGIRFIKLKRFHNAFWRNDIAC